jgi:P22_AR N-terminal domain
MSENEQKKPSKPDLSLVQVTVCDEPIDAGFDGCAVWVSVRRVCDVLAIDYAGQWRKLRGKLWATVAMKSTVAEDGKTRQVFCISHKSLPMWLATIEPTRSTAPDLAKKLARFQVEAAQVLAAHFFGTPAAGLSPELLELLRAVPGLLRQVRELTEARSPASLANDPPIGSGAAQVHITGRIYEIADLLAESIGCTKKKAVNSIRTSLEMALRNEIEFCFATNRNWEVLPTSHLQEVKAALDRMLGVARHVAKMSASDGFRQLKFPYPEVKGTRKRPDSDKPS